MYFMTSIQLNHTKLTHKMQCLLHPVNFYQVNIERDMQKVWILYAFFLYVCSKIFGNVHVENGKNVRWQQFTVFDLDCIDRLEPTRLFMMHIYFGWKLTFKRIYWRRSWFFCDWMKWKWKKEHCVKWTIQRNAVDSVSLRFPARTKMNINSSEILIWLLLNQIA